MVLCTVVSCLSDARPTVFFFLDCSVWVGTPRATSFCAALTNGGSVYVGVFFLSAVLPFPRCFCLGWSTSSALFLRGADEPELCAVFVFFCFVCGALLPFFSVLRLSVFVFFFFHILIGGCVETAGILAAVCHRLCCGAVGGGRWAVAVAAGGGALHSTIYRYTSPQNDLTYSGSSE
jgi:hypothetical protein